LALILAIRVTDIEFSFDGTFGIHRGDGIANESAACKPS
jgi:hypothetical protein